jgi:hypothetical protein
MQPPDDEKALAVGRALLALLAATGLLETGKSEPGDELVAFPFGLERRAARSLVRTRRLAVERIGRRLYTRRSALVALVEASPHAPSPVVADPAEAARAAYASKSLRIVRGGTGR